MKREVVTTSLIFLWSLMFAQLVRAATIAEFMGAYDPKLLTFAAGSALAGGWIRTILSLQNDDRVVRHKISEAAWDTVKALVAGMVAFFVVQALRAAGYAVPVEVRFGAIVAAGWSRMASVDFLADAVKNFILAKFKQAEAAPLDKTPKDK